MPSKKPWELWERRELKIQSWGQRKETNTAHFIYLNNLGSQKLPRGLFSHFWNNQRDPSAACRKRSAGKGRDTKGIPKQDPPSQSPEWGMLGRPQKSTDRGGNCWKFLFAVSFFSPLLFLRRLRMNLGKLEGEFTWYLRDFLGFTNILSFLLKKDH